MKKIFLALLALFVQLNLAHAAGPIITSQPPTMLYIGSGTNVTISVGATGSGLNYQWRYYDTQHGGVDTNVLNGSKFGGANSSTLTVVAPLASGYGGFGDYDLEIYYCMISNAAGTTNSLSTVLNVEGKPIIAVQPVNTTADIGDFVSVSATVANTPGNWYFWRKGGNIIPGQINSALEIASAVAADSGTYDVVITNAAGSVTSSPFTLSIAKLCADQPSGLVSWWKGDGLSPVDSIAHNDFPANSTFVAGEVGDYAFYLGAASSSPFLTTSGAGMASGSAPRSMDMWVYLRSVSSTGVLAGYGAFGGSYGDSFCLNVVNGNLHVGNVGAFPDAGWFSLPVGSWFHLATTYDGSNIVAYVNGAPQGTPASPFFFSTPTNAPFYLGGLASNNRNVECSLDDVRVYNRALTATEVTNIYAAGSYGVCGNTSASSSFLKSYRMVKAQLFSQTNALMPVLQSGQPYVFQATAQASDPYDGITHADFSLPNSSTRIQLNDGETGFDFEATFPTLTALNTSYPNSLTSPYNLSITTANQGSNSVGFYLPNDSYYPGNAPHISNAAAVANMDANSTFTFTWDAFSGGTASDLIDFAIYDMNGNKIIESAGLESGSFFNGTETQFTIPPGTLTNGVPYKVTLLFARFTGFNSSAFAGAIGVSGYAKITDFPFTPLSSDHAIVSDFGIAKGIQLTQTGSSITNVVTNDFHFDAFVDANGSDAVTAGSIKRPSGVVNALSGNGDDGGSYNTNFATLAALNAAFPAGNYKFTLATTYAGTKTSTLALPADNYPNNPHFLNYDQIGYMNAHLDFTFNWDPFITTNANDFIELSILDGDGSDDDDHIEPVMLPATATSYTLPNGSIPTGEEYTVQLRFVRVVGKDTNTLSMATGLVGFIKQTAVTFTTLQSDLRYYSVGKGQAYSQNSTNAATLQTAAGPYIFRSAMSERNLAAGDLVSGTLRKPDFNTYSLNYTANYDPTLLLYVNRSSQLDLDYDYPNGTYKLLGVLNSGNFNATATITGDTYPNAPHISNYSAVQAINPAQDFTLNWDAFSGGTHSDVIQLVIRNAGGKAVYQSAVIAGETTPILDGTATSITIPAFSLPSAQAYQATLTFTKITDTTSSTGMGGKPVIGYFADTTFPITALATTGVFPVANTSAKEYSVSVDHDNCGSFLVGVQGANNELFAQIINSSGQVANSVDIGFSSSSAPLVTYGSDDNEYAMVFNGQPGGIVSVHGEKTDVKSEGLTTATSSGGPIMVQMVYPGGGLHYSSQLTGDTGSPQARGVVGDSHGNYLLVWEDARTGTNNQIYAQFFDYYGAFASEIPIARGRNQKWAALASDGYDYLVAWQQQNTNAAGKWDVMGCFVDIYGHHAEAPFLISQTNSATPGNLTVTFAATNFIVAWSRDTGRGSPAAPVWDLSARLVGDDGTMPRREFALSTATGDQVLPRSSYDGSAFLVDWLDVASATAPNTNAQIKAKFVSPVTGATGPEFAIFQGFRGKIPVIAPLAFDGSRYFAVGSFTSTNNATGSFADSDVYGTFISVAVPSIISSPQSKYVAIGDTINLSAAVSGQPPLQYQWTFRGTNIPGATDTILRITNASPANAGCYAMTVQNVSGSATTEPATITVLAKPLITTQPVGQTNASPGSSFVLSVVATGGDPLSYQWRLNGTTLPGATDTAYTVGDVELNNSGFYSVVVQNPVGAVNSVRAPLLVTGPALDLSDNFPGSGTNQSSSGFGAGSNAGATSETGEPMHGGHVGGSSVWFNWKAPADGIVTFNTLGSSFDTLIAVYVGNSVNNLTRLVGDDDSAGFFASQVSFNATNGSVYHIAIDGRAGAQGNIVLTWNLETTSDDIPVITVNPSNQTVVVSQPATFTVVAQARSALTYQWYFNNNQVTDATNSTLSYLSADASFAGEYYVTVTSAANRTRTSASATLEINSTTNATPSEDKFEDVFNTPATLAAYLPHYTRGPKGQLVPVAAGALGTQLMNNFNATKEDGEPNHAGVAGGSSRWFSLQALDDGTMIVDTVGSDFDTVLAVYTGTNLLTLKTIGSDDNSAADGIRSQVTFNATNGTTYLVAVDGVNGAQGNIVLNWRLGNLPVITQGLTNKLVKLGTNLVLTIVATNNPAAVPITYQWQYNGANIQGATDPSLALNNFQSANVGVYRALASNYVGVASSTGILASGAPTVNLTAPTNGLYSKGPTNIALSASTFGLTVTNLTFYQGATKIGTRTSLPYTMTWSNVAAGVYSLTARATDLLGKVGTSAVVKVVIDNAKPTVAIALPAKNSRSANANATVSGTVTDNNGVGQLVYQFNSDAPVTIDLTTNKWSVPVTCIPGTNYFRAKAIDLAGNESLMATNSFFYIVSNVFSLNIVGNGTVTKNFTGTMLELGRGYQLTAKPLNAQNVFSNWAGYSPASNNLVLNFIMSPGLAITANFVPNPFPALKGTYNGLYYETNQVKLTSAGMFTFTLSDQGVLSGKLISGTPLTLSGSFNAAGLATLSIPRTKQSNLVAQIQLDMDNHSDVVNGSLTDPNWIAVLDGDRAITNAAAAGVSGTYVTVLPGGDSMGDSFLTATVKTNGALTATGSLADGVTTAVVSESTGIAHSGRWPFFLNLYTGKGLLIGWMNLTNNNPSVGGEASWIKPTNAPAIKFYPLGFTNDIGIAGSIFTVVPKTSFLNTTSGTVILSGGNLTFPITNTFTVDSNNLVKTFSLSNNITVPSTNKLTLTITPATGQFSGTFIHPDTKKSTSIKGGLLQQSTSGVGFFPGTNKTGSVNLQGN